jgi:alpha-L-arabinofuranosidase
MKIATLAAPGGRRLRGDRPLDDRSRANISWRRLMKRWMTALVACMGSVGVAQVPAGPAEVSVQVYTDHPGTVIDRHIYGQFAEHLGRGIYEGIWVGEKSRIPNVNGYRKDVVDALRRIHVPVIRWPGGCFGEIYDWRDGIGPRSKRPVRTVVKWPDTVETNEFGTHEFLNFAELIGADAYVSGNVGSLTPYAMQQWLQYMTDDNNSTLAQERRANGRAKPWNIKFFGIGNETWGCGGDMRPGYAADVNARYAMFANAPASMGMVKVASGASVQGGGDYEAFTDAMMRHGNLQALSFHYYAMPTGSPKDTATGFTEEGWADVLDLARQMEPLVSRTEAIMDKYDPARKVGLFVDEWGTWYQQEPGAKEGAHYQQNSLRDAEVAALTLNIFHRHTDRVKMANIAQMVNVLQAMILTDGDKMLLTPTYHLFDLYQPFMGATPFSVAVAGPNYRYGTHAMPMIDSSAARAVDGTLYLALVNVDPHRNAHVTTNLTGVARGHILTARTMDAHNSFADPNAVRPREFTSTSERGHLAFDLPAMAIAVVQVH